ncbi:MAG: hypothetical protein JJLCMIEE_02969 [Acidimicrobiales bacterium]|nr:MAG: bifunctional (p)ppGpp synthetase/guanosine-3',5'-bis(diphosphate) 3'-pyrophosphohydrolase [Actinomycetota bacterium]MBV6509856.1 hypothetical protein [Acidimicrobiales bacterium]RIK06205.1 MAG: guanosine polyphosphate pyrophosphohydrolase [Acidobacteriota bacterium]
MIATVDQRVAGASTAEQTATSRLARALDYAAWVHRDDQRRATGAPYLSHLLGVCALVTEFGGDEEQQMVALLHDTAEDHGGEKQLAEIEAEFGTAIAEMVRALSDSLTGEDIPKAAWEERKRAHVAALRSVPERTLLVAACDKLDNVRSLTELIRRDGAKAFASFTAAIPSGVADSEEGVDLALGRDRSVWYYRTVAELVTERIAGPLGERLTEAVDDLAGLAASV